MSVAASRVWVVVRHHGWGGGPGELNGVPAQRERLVDVAAGEL